MQNSPNEKVRDALAEYETLVANGHTHDEALQELESYVHPIIVAAVERRLGDNDGCEIKAPKKGAQ